jgi:hypothetical protein
MGSTSSLGTDPPGMLEVKKKSAGKCVQCDGFGYAFSPLPVLQNGAWWVERVAAANAKPCYRCGGTGESNATNA